MNNQELIKQFEDLNWTKQEAQLYLTLLQLGPQPASAVANHLNKNRITIYHAMERLVQKKVLESNLGKNVVIYSAKSPELLLQQLKDRKNKMMSSLDLEIDTLNWLKPQLEKLEIHDLIRPQVQLFHGIEALKNIYQLTLESSQMAAYYQPWPVGREKELYEIDDWHTAERVKRKIPVKILIAGTKEGISFAAVKKELKETIVIPEKIFPFYDVTIITDNQILIFSLSDKLGIAIKSQYIANNQRAVFNLAWEGAKLIIKSLDRE